jgi:hypothetical protein
MGALIDIIQAEVVILHKHSYAVQYNSTYPESGYPDRQLSGSAWPLG